MSDLSEVVDSLENRISKLLHRFQKMKQVNGQLEEEIEKLRSKQAEYDAEIEELRSRSNSLRLANSMLGSDQHKTETKLKINAMVREIEQCIAQLSV